MRLYDKRILSLIADMESNTPSFTYTHLTHPDWLSPHMFNCGDMYPLSQQPDAEDRQLFAEDFLRYTQALARNTVYQTLEIKGFHLDKIRAQQLGSALAQNRGIRILTLEKNLLQKNISHIISALTENETNIHTLTIDDNEIGDIELQLILPILSGKTKIKTLELYRGGYDIYEKKFDSEATGFTAQGVMPLATALRTAHDLENLKLRGFEIGDIGASYFAEALRDNQHLKTLDLENSNISEQGAKAFGIALQTNDKLQSLNLSKNNITEIGATPLMENLSLNRSLRFLMLSDNRIGDAGALAVANMLIINKSLSCLSLSRCGITQLGSIAAALKGNIALRALIINNNFYVEQLALLVKEIFNKKSDAQTLVYLNLLSLQNSQPIQDIKTIAAHIPHRYYVKDDLLLVRGWELFKRQNSKGLVPKDRIKDANSKTITINVAQMNFDNHIIETIASYVAQDICIAKNHPRSGMGV